MLCKIIVIYGYFKTSYPMWDFPTNTYNVAMIFIMNSDSRYIQENLSCFPDCNIVDYIQSIWKTKNSEKSFLLKLGWLRIFLILPEGIIAVVEKSLKWCSKSKSSSCCLVEVVHANNKMYTLLKPLLMHVLYSFFLFPSMLKIYNLSFIRSRRKKKV